MCLFLQLTTKLFILEYALRNQKMPLRVQFDVLISLVFVSPAVHYFKEKKYNKNKQILTLAKLEICGIS